MPRCSECDVIIPSVNALFLHLKVVHSKNKSDNFTCAEQNCYRLMVGWYKFKRHLLTHDFNNDCKPTSNKRKRTECDSDEEGSDEEHVNDFNWLIERTCKSESEKFLKSSEQHVLQYCAKLYANHQLPRNFVQHAMHDTKELMFNLISCLKPALSEICYDLSTNSNLETSIHEKIDLLLEPFSSLNTEHMRLKALLKSGCFIQSHDDVIGDRVDDKKRQGYSVKEIVPVHLKFIPLRFVLQKVFSMPGVFSKTKSYMTQLESEKEILENFVQGNLWREKVSCHFKEKFVVPLFIYFDDFEVNNPLGSHAGIQKLGAVYYSIPCFPPEVNSLVENIFLALLFHSSDRIDYKNAMVFKTVIDELNFLQREGILVNTDCGEERIFFALGLIVGDNLGLNSILGFMEGFNANYYCRLCTTSKFEARTVFKEGNLRRETYNADVLELDPQKTGTKEKSVWNDVDHFETAQNFFSDWLHEGPEGAAGTDMTLILHYFVSSKDLEKDEKLSLNVLNDRLKSFNYQDNGISNPPPLVSLQEVMAKQLKMSASEMQNFILLFGVLVGDLVPHNNVWSLYLLLRKIMDLVLSRKIQKGCSSLLRSLVQEHHSLFNDIFPNVNLKPKAHLWVHYGTVLEQSGPIINMSTARFESKHRDKKKEANATSSRKNITHTLCMKEQLSMCYRFLSNRGLTPKDCDGPFECLDHISACHNYSLFKNTLPESFHGPCLQLNWTKFHGIMYKPRTCFVMRLDGEEELLPVFGAVETLLQNNDGKIILVCRVMKSLGFDADVHAYRIHDTNVMECILINNLHSSFPVIVAKWGNGYSFATVRHAL